MILADNLDSKKQWKNDMFPPILPKGKLFPHSLSGNHYDPGHVSKIPAKHLKRILYFSFPYKDLHLLSENAVLAHFTAIASHEIKNDINMLKVLQSNISARPMKDSN